MPPSPPQTTLTLRETGASAEAIPMLEADLCLKCKALLSGTRHVRKLRLYEVDNGHEEHHMLYMLRRSSRTCRFCKLLWDGLESKMRAAQFFYGLDLDTPTWRNATTLPMVRVEVPNANDDSGYAVTFRYKNLPEFAVQLIPVEDKIDAMESLSHLRDPATVGSANTSSDMGLEFVKAWIGNCLANHASCNKYRWPRCLPSRLLEIGDKLMLRPCEGLPPDTPYTTLSHRWATLETTRLTKSSYCTFSEVCIPLGDLPLKYQHAISYTKRLGIRYIWIDSLCIIQDSEEDWVKEASRMGQVYSNSYCNIAATASSGDGGLFHNRDPTSISSCKVRPQWDGLDRGVHYCGIRGEFFNEVLTVPLNTRGWVLQERFLAPRVLHFGLNQLFWECSQSSASEMFPEGLNHWISTLDNKQYWALNERLEFPQTETQKDYSKRYYYKPKIYYRDWQDSVRLYSRCRLTVASDKLAAISGIARLIHDLLGGKDVYLAGLWKNELILFLYWEVLTKPSETTRVEPYRAPSWSWASLDAPVRTNLGWNGVASHLVQVLDATTTPNKRFPFRPCSQWYDPFEGASLPAPYLHDR